MISNGRRATLGLGLACAAGAAFGQANYPERTVRIVVPFAPGGGTDIYARMIAQPLSEALGRSVVVENKPGAAGNIGTAEVARAAPDGHTLLLAGTATGVNHSMFRKLPFDTLNDLLPISIFALSPLVVVVHPSVPANSMQELIALARARPGVLNYSSGGIGTANHLGGELLKLQTSTDIVHVPYKGGGAAMNDLLAGQVQIQIGTIASLREYVRAGRLRPLATTGARRSPAMPDLPTVSEAGVPGYEITAWYGLFAPAGTPRPIVDRLAAEVGRISRLPNVQEALRVQGTDGVGNGPEEAARFFRNEVDRWARVVKASNLYAD